MIGKLGMAMQFDFLGLKQSPTTCQLQTATVHTLSGDWDPWLFLGPGERACGVCGCIWLTLGRGYIGSFHRGGTNGTE